MIATGRSDYPNQVNNVLCFPFIFRGALDVGATTINEEMKMAATLAIAAIAEAEPSDVVTSAYGTQEPFGPEYLIPRPFDPRLITTVAPAVAEAAMKTGVATRPITDMKAYRDQLAASSTARARSCSRSSRRRPRRQAGLLRRGRGRPGAARGPGGGRRKPGAPDPGRPARCDRSRRSRELGLHIQAGKDFEVADFDDDE